VKYLKSQKTGVNVVIDCVDAEETIRDSARSWSVSSSGNQIGILLASSVFNEKQVQCSFWGNYNELCEVIELAKQGKVKQIVRKRSYRDT